jgi:hypothetical protein
MKFNDQQWYRIRLEVRKDRLRGWIDDRLVVDVKIKGKKLSIRPEVDLCRPFGIASWETRAGLRKIRVRPLPKAAAGSPRRDRQTKG